MYFDVMENFEILNSSKGALIDDNKINAGTPWVIDLGMRKTALLAESGEGSFRGGKGPQ